VFVPRCSAFLSGSILVPSLPLSVRSPTYVRGEWIDWTSPQWFRRTFGNYALCWFCDLHTSLLPVLNTSWVAHNDFNFQVLLHFTFSAALQARTSTYGFLLSFLCERSATFFIHTMYICKWIGHWWNSEQCICNFPKSSLLQLFNYFQSEGHRIIFRKWQGQVIFFFTFFCWRVDVKTWWLSNEESMKLRSENGWTIDLQPHTVTYSHTWWWRHCCGDWWGDLRDTLRVLRRSYLHAWTIKGSHARFVTYQEHTAKCKTTTCDGVSYDIVSFLNPNPQHTVSLYTFIYQESALSSGPFTQKQTVTQKLVSQGECICRVGSHTGSGRCDDLLSRKTSFGR